MEENGHEWTCPKCREKNTAPFPKKGEAKKSTKPHPQLPRIEQTRSLSVQVNLFQKHLFLPQLTHNHSALRDIDSVFYTSVQGTYFYQVIFGTKLEIF